MTFYEWLVVLAIAGILTGINVWALLIRPRRPRREISFTLEPVITPHPDERLIAENHEFKRMWLESQAENEALRRELTDRDLLVLDRDFTIYLLDKALARKERMRKQWHRLWWKVRQEKIAMDTTFRQMTDELEFA